MVGLVSCGKRKRDCPCPAGDLYVGEFFGLQRRWIELMADEWGILSARHGLLLPGDVIAPYEATMADLSKSEQRAWALRVQEQVRARWGASPLVVTTAGAAYRKALDPFNVWCPFDSLPDGRLGYQRRFLINDTKRMVEARAA